MLEAVSVSAMGWQAAGFLVHNTSWEQVSSILPGKLQDYGEQISADDALRMDGEHEFRMGVVGEWTVISDPGAQIFWDQQVGEPLSVQRRALAFIVHSVSSIYGFGLYLDGFLLRKALYAEGEVQEEQGDRLPEEKALPEPCLEDYVMDLVPRLTGIRLEKIDAPFRVLRSR